MWFELDPEKGGSGIIKNWKNLIVTIKRRGIPVGFLNLILIVAVFPHCSASFSDTLETTTGEVLEGSVWEYDDFSYMVILENGGKAVVSRLHVSQVDWKSGEKSAINGNRN